MNNYEEVLKAEGISRKWAPAYIKRVPNKLPLATFCEDSDAKTSKCSHTDYLIPAGWKYYKVK